MYRPTKINITKAQCQKALAGKPIMLKANQIGTGDTYVSLHPRNVKSVEKAALNGRGCSLHISHGELADTCQRMEGAGFWGDVWGGLKSVWGVLKKTGAATQLLDMATPLAAGFVGPTGAMAGRSLVKSLTGAGVKQTKAQKMEKLKGMGLYLS